MSAGLSDSRASLYSSLNSGGGGNGSSGSLILGTGYDSHGRLQKLAASAAVTAETLGSGLGDHSGLLIDPALVSVTHKLAAGAYGAVYLGVFAGVNVVVKELYSQVLEGDNEELLHEARMLHALRHPRIVTFYGVTWRVSGPAPPGWKGGSGAAPEPVNIERSSAGTSYESAGVAQSLNDTADWLEVDEASGDDFLSSSAPTWGAAFFGGSELGDRPLAVSDDGAFALNGGGGSGASRPARAARPTPVRSTSRPRALSPDSQAWAGLMQAAEDEHAKLLLVIEYCGQGSLGEAIRKGNYDTRADFFRHAIQLAGTLDWLHRKSPPIIHRDIKPGNMLLDDRGDLKLCDLGLARAQPLESGEGGTSDALATMTGGLGSAPFVPPEIMKGGASGVGGFEAATVGSLSNSLYDPTFIDSSEDTGDSRLESYLAGTPNKIRYDGRCWDVYSMAMTFVYMWGQKPLYPGQTRYQIITGVAGGMRPELRTGPPISSGKRGFRSFPPSLAKLLQEMWHHDPASRPTASDVVHALEAMKAELAEWGRTGKQRKKNRSRASPARRAGQNGERRAVKSERRASG